MRPRPNMNDPTWGPTATVLFLDYSRTFFRPSLSVAPSSILFLSSYSYISFIPSSIVLQAVVYSDCPLGLFQGPHLCSAVDYGVSGPYRRLKPGFSIIAQFPRVTRTTKSSLCSVMCKHQSLLFRIHSQAVRVFACACFGASNTLHLISSFCSHAGHSLRLHLALSASKERHLHVLSILVCLF